jgi:FkbM family methyltransferase
MTFRSLVLTSSLVVCRKTLYRIARFLIEGARGDVRSDPRTNGEMLVQKVAMNLSRSPSVVFDVGANRGDWTASLLSHSNGKQVTVHAFEPCLETHERLARRIRENGWTNVQAIQQACSSSAGTATIHINPADSTLNTLSELIEPAFVTVTSVGVISVDEYSRKNGIEYIDLLKIDAEGWDFEVILGASQMLRSKSVRLLQFEYNHRWIGSRHYLRDVFLLLLPMGYRIGKLVGTQVEFYPTWHWELETYRDGNYVACSPEVSDKLPQRKLKWLPQLSWPPACRDESPAKTTNNLVQPAQ